jgi:hypothetical protein
MKLIIAGGRDFNDWEYMVNRLDEIQEEIVEIVSGKAKGADSMGELYARRHNIPVMPFPAM